MTEFTTELVRDVKIGKGTRKLWRVSPPFPYDRGATTEYVVTSAVVAYSGPETYIFPADENGEVIDWGELPGSFRGDLDHDAAISGLAEDWA